MAGGRAARLWAGTGWALAGLAGLNLMVVAILYQRYAGYVDHGESAISAMAWRMLDGATVYLPLDSPDWITNVYGPLTYLWHAWPLALFGGSVGASKVAAMVAAILLPPALLVLARGLGPLTGWTIAFLVGLTTINIAFPVVIRPDALLTLVVALAVFAARRAKRWGWRATLAIGLAAGAAVNLKVHGFLYLAPIGLFHLWGQWRRLPLLAASALAMAGLPFLSPSFPLREYLAWFGPLAAKENQWRVGWYWEVALYLAPLLLLALGPRRRPSGAERAYLGGYVLCLVLVLFPATKLGGGVHYFMPFLPLAADLIRRACAPGPTLGQRAAITVLALIPLAASYQGERRFFKKLEWTQSAAAVAEIETLLDRYHDKRVQMAVGYLAATDFGASLSYHFYQWRNLPIYRGHPYTLDAGIAQELSKAGIALPPEAITRIKTCHTEIWLTPKDSLPFGLTGYYNREVFPDAARAAFFAHNTKIASGTFYDVWACSARQ